MDQFREKQKQQARLHHQLPELGKRRKQAVEFADELSAVVAYTARINDAAMGKAYEARAAFINRATEVSSEACGEAHRIQGNYFDLSKSFASFGEGGLMLLRDHIRALKDPTE